MMEVRQAISEIIREIDMSDLKCTISDDGRSFMTYCDVKIIELMLFNYNMGILNVHDNVLVKKLMGVLGFIFRREF